MTDHAHFSKGSEIEATVDDDGFHGAWYAATVVKPPSQSPNPKVTVQYKTLIEDEIGNQMLRETLDIDAIRPAPPRGARRKFFAGEEVDAYHSDGWWEGVVTEALEDSKFFVFFRGTKERLVFEERDLRLHREWVNGKWIPPLDNEIAPHKAIVKCSKTVGKEKFSKGSLVEISSDEEGFRGAWYAASVIKLTGKDKFLIEYQSLRTNDDTEFLKEEVDVFHIRPCPPDTVVVNRFSRFEEVDALYNDGWWVGVIYRVLSRSKYIVFFRGTNEEMEFDHSDLRVHQDWMDGKWLVPSRWGFACAKFEKDRDVGGKPLGPFLDALSCKVLHDQPKWAGYHEERFSASTNVASKKSKSNDGGSIPSLNTNEEEETDTSMTNMPIGIKQAKLKQKMGYSSKENVWEALLKKINNSEEAFRKIDEEIRKLEEEKLAFAKQCFEEKEKALQVKAKQREMEQKDRFMFIKLDDPSYSDAQRIYFKMKQDEIVKRMMNK